MRIVRTIILLSAIVILMPSPPESQKDSTAGLIASSDVSVPEMFVAATRTASDLGGFCGREPQVCETAVYVAHMLEAKAKYSVRLIYDWANAASTDSQPVKADAVDQFVTSSTKVAADGPPSQNTLKVEDRLPVWRAPTIGPGINS